MTLAAKRYSVPLLFAVFVTSAAAYDHPLESLAIRDAYFLGADNHQSAEFLSHYVKTLASTKSGPYVSQIEVRTPFAQAVEISREHTVGYSAQQAEEDYRKNAGTVQVRVQILIGSPFGVSNVVRQPAACQGVNRMNSALNCFHDFRFHFNQQNQEKDKSIRPQSSYGVPIYTRGDGSVLSGGDVWFTFRASQIDSAPFHVSVTRPDGQKFSADFDLTTLR
jgi:hypothetical protein